MATDTKATHTPGPWKLETVRTQVGICHKVGPFPTGVPHRPETYACIYVDGVVKAEHAPQQLANARVMAAAPNLLTALKMFVDRYTGLVNSGDCGNWNPEDEDHVVIARAAIAKAEG